jgi:Tfp pilus assembly protein PilO
MKATQQRNSLQTLGDSIVFESMKYGPIITFALVGAMSFGFVYLVYSYLLSGWAESNTAARQQVVKKEQENAKTERMLADEDQFRSEFVKVVNLYQEAKPLLPEETEVSDVLGQVETAARRNGVTLTGLMAVKQSVKSPKAEKLYEREIPALVTGPYPQIVRFFTDISRMPRILVVRDFSVVSLKSSVSAGFTLVAYHAPPPAEMPRTPGDLTQNLTGESAK